MKNGLKGVVEGGLEVMVEEEEEENKEIAEVQSSAVMTLSTITESPRDDKQHLNGRVHNGRESR